MKSVVTSPKGKSVVTSQPLSSNTVNTYPMASSFQCYDSTLFPLPIVHLMCHYFGKHKHLRPHYRKLTSILMWFHMSFLSQEAKCRLSLLQLFLPTSILFNQVLFKARLVIVGMVWPGSIFLQIRMVHKLCSITKKKRLKHKMCLVEFHSNFKLILEVCSFITIVFIDLLML